MEVSVSGGNPFCAFPACLLSGTVFSGAADWRRYECILPADVYKRQEYFTALFKTSENRPLNNVLWRQSCFLTKVTDIEKLRDYVRTIPTEETSEVKLLVAILEFPYIVDVCKNL